MATLKSAPKAGTRGEPEKTRNAILKAALHEFANEGVSGARTDEIARRAGVNKALLYYHFKDKESLYGAAIDSVFSGLRKRMEPVLESDLSPREKVLLYAGTHFDYLAESPEYPRVMQREMMRQGRTKSPHLKRIVEKYLRPLFSRLMEIVAEGIRTGEFREVDVQRFLILMAASTVHYFNIHPIARLIAGDQDLFSPQSLAAQRAAILDFISHALFKQTES